MYITPRATDIEALYIINTRYFCASKKEPPGLEMERYLTFLC